MKTLFLSPTRIRRGAILLMGVLLMVLLVAQWLVHSGTAHAHSPVLIQPHVCANQPDAATCTQQDPYQQQCVDAQTVTRESIPAFYQGQQIGVVELRYSPTCDSFWDRVIAYAGAPVSQVTIFQYTLFANMTPDADGSLQVYCNMEYHARIAPPDTASFEIAPTGQLVTVLVP